MAPQTETEIVDGIGSDYGVKYGFSNPDEAKDYFFKSGRGLSHEVVEAMRSTRTSPTGCGRPATRRSTTSWRARSRLGRRSLRDRLREHLLLHQADRESGRQLGGPPADILDTWDKLGIPAAEKEVLAGVGAQYESEVVYHSLQKKLTDQGVIFLDMDSGLREHEELVKQYFGTIIPSNDNKFAALNTAVWSGGSFIYVPPGVHIDLPLQAYFRINAENMGQFERTMILVDEGAYVHYVEGCTAPIYSRTRCTARRRDRRQEGRPLPLHDDSELVEQRLQPCYQARRRPRERDDGMGRREPRLEADDEVPGDLAARRPRPRRGAVDRVCGCRSASGRGRQVRPRRQDTTSVITSKSISKNGGRAGYRGLLKVDKSATGAKSKVVCDALILDEDSRSDTYPYIDIDCNDVDIGHEATVSKIGEEQLFYLMSRGLSESEASAMIVSGFVEPITKELPLEYAVEMNRLIQLQMEGSVG